MVARHGVRLVHHRRAAERAKKGCHLGGLLRIPIRHGLASKPRPVLRPDDASGVKQSLTKAR
jgi:hypothetical protein